MPFGPGGVSHGWKRDPWTNPTRNKNFFDPGGVVEPERGERKASISGL
jgi:hypothetical protein